LVVRSDSIDDYSRFWLKSQVFFSKFQKFS